jgi:spore coat protein U-like protein
MTTRNWMKRSVGALAVAAGALAVMGPSTPAVAGTATGTFTVSTTVDAACTFTTANMTFGAYTAGTANPVNGNAAFSLKCPSASGTVYLTFSTTTSNFQMTGPAGAVLSYTLCNDAPCTQQYDATNDELTAGVTTITANPQTYTLYGQIPGNQTPTATGAFTQTVTATLNY